MAKTSTSMSVTSAQRSVSSTPMPKSKPSRSPLSFGDRLKKTTKAERRRSMPPTLTVSQLDLASLSGVSLAAYERQRQRRPPHRAGSSLSPPLTPRSASSECLWSRDKEPTPVADISVDCLRSNSGLALHTNHAALRRYTDYNMDGSSRLPPTTDEGSGTDSQTSLHTAPSMPEVPSLFSRDTVRAVLEDSEARHRLQAYATLKGAAQAMEFLDKVEEYSKAVHGVTALMANISTSFTSVGATQPLNLPKTLARSLNSDIKHVSSSLLPSLDNLFGEAGHHIEHRIVRDIYPAFAASQITRCMKSSLGATTAHAAQTPFLFFGLGHAFCLTNPHRPDNPIVYASDTFAHVMGYARSEDMPRSGRFVKDPADRDADTFSEEIVLTRRSWDNQPFWSLVCTCPLRSASGRVRFNLSSIINISDALRTQEDIVKALRTTSVSPAVSADSNDSNDSSSRSAKADTASTSVTGSSVFLNMSAEPSLSSSSKLGGLIASRKFRGFGGSDFGGDKSSKVSGGSKSFFKPLARKLRSRGTDRAGSDDGTEASSYYLAPESRADRPQTGRSWAPSQSTGSAWDSSVLSPPLLPATPPPEEDSLPLYAQFMVLQFAPGSGFDADFISETPSPVSRQSSRRTSNARASPAAAPASVSSGDARLKVTFCSPSMLDMLGLSPSTQESILYHDVFSVLSEVAGSPSITPTFQSVVCQRLAACEPASMELSVPTGGSPMPGLLSDVASPSLSHTPSRVATPIASTKSSRRSSVFIVSRPRRNPEDDKAVEDDEHVGCFTSGTSSGKDQDEWWNVRSSSAPRHSGVSERPQTSDLQADGEAAPATQRMMSHWTPLKDAEGNVAWVMLVLAPVSE